MPRAPGLFDTGPRTDKSPSARADSRFEFLNRIDRPHFDAVRDLMEEWFANYPTAGQIGLRNRFRSPDDGQHSGAFWELYLHEVHRRLGFSIEIEPSIRGTSRRPDFLMERDDHRFYLEATLVRYSDPAIAARHRQGQLLDLVDSAFDSDFYVRVIVAVAGPRTPARNALVDPIENWLAGLRWAPARQAAERGEWDAPQQTFNAADSVVTLEAHPKPPHLRYARDFRSIWAGPTEGGAVDERTPVLKDLRDKAKAYGNPDAPFVIAILCLRDFVSWADIENALYGQEVVKVPLSTTGGPAGESYLTRDFKGLWQRGTAPSYTRVTGVLAAVGLAPWAVAHTSLSLWENPWAAHSLAIELPWRTVRGDLASNRLAVRGATRAPHEILALPSEWPGPGNPWDD